MNKDVYRDGEKIVFRNRVNWHSFLYFSKILHRIINIDNQNTINIDFSNINRAYPNGMAPIISEIYYYKDNGYLFEVIPPNDPDILSIFLYYGWLYYIDSNRYNPLFYLIIPVHLS